MAIEFFAYIMAKSVPGSRTASAGELIEECQFRIAVQCLVDGDTLEAAAVLGGLETETGDADRRQMCRFYIALCQFAEGDYENASGTISVLMVATPDERRYQYHKIIADFACSREAEALQRGSRAESADHLPAGSTSDLVVRVPLRAGFKPNRGSELLSRL